MIKGYLALMLLALPSFGLAMKHIFEQGPGEQEHVLEQLRKEPTYFNLLPKELISELELRRKYAQTLHIIESSDTLEAASGILRKLSSQAAYSHYLNNPIILDNFIYILVDRFNQSPIWIARLLETEGATRWLKEIEPLQKELLDAAARGNLEKVKQFIDQGVNINSKGFYTTATPLMIVAERGHIDIVKYLLSQSAEVNAKDMFGSTALILAVRNDHPEVVKLLLEHKADPNIKNNMRATALLEAVERKNPKIVKLLLEHGADPEIKGIHNQTALDIAQKENNQEIVKLLEEAIAKQQK